MGALLGVVALFAIAVVLGMVWADIQYGDVSCAFKNCVVVK